MCQISPQWLIPVFRPSVANPELSLERLKRVAERGWLTNNGPEVRELESRLAVHFGTVPELVAVVSSATSAIHGIAAGFFGSTIRVPAWTFQASVLGVLAAGKKVEFRDVEMADWRMGLDYAVPDSVAQMLVVPFGVGRVEFDWPDSLEVLVDGAAAIGDLSGELSRVPRSSAVVISLHATKALGIGEGGVAIFGSYEKAAEFRAWRNFGFSGERSSIIPGYNAKMGEYVAAFLNEEMTNWSRYEAEWGSLRSLASAVSDSVGLVVQPGSKNSISPYWNAVFESQEHRSIAETELARKGIESRRWWSNLSNDSAMSHIQATSLGNASQLASTVLGLPFHRGLSKFDIEKIGETLQSIRGHRE